MIAVSLEQEMTAARHEHLIPGREIHMQDMRGYRFCDLPSGRGFRTETLCPEGSRW